MGNPSHRRISNSAGIALQAALVGAALIAVLASGCGGGSGPSESQIRERLEAGVAKLVAAKNFEATVLTKSFRPIQGRRRNRSPASR